MNTLIGQRDYKGKIVNSKTNEPIPYVNVGILETAMGTVSDEEGLFHLFWDYDKISKDSQILFSSLGYETLYIPVSDIKMVFDDYPIITLNPINLKLDEVVVSDFKGRFVKSNVGYRNYGEKHYGYWKDNIAKGGELATRIKVKKGLRRLNQFEFEVWHNPSDSLLVRVNIYDYKDDFGHTFKNLNSSGKNILCMVKKNDRMVKVDLIPYDIYVKKDFIVSLELLEVYGKEELGLVLAASSNGYSSYRKYASQDKWEHLSNFNMAYYIESELMVSEKEAQRVERKSFKEKEKLHTLSGYVFMRGKMIPNVSIFNHSNKEMVLSDEKGHYVIPVQDKDILTFSKEGLKDFHIRVEDKITQNIIMKVK